MSVLGYARCEKCGWQGRRQVPDVDYLGPAGPCPKCAAALRAVRDPSTQTPPDSEIQSVRSVVIQAAGDAGRVMVWRHKSMDIIRVKIRCELGGGCKRGNAKWETRSDHKAPGTGATPAFTLDVWADHLDRHGLTCPWSTDVRRGEALAKAKAEEASIWAATAPRPLSGDRD